MINQTIPRLEKAFKLIKGKNVVLLEYGKAVVHDKKPYHVNYTLSKCDCGVRKNIKCSHIWAAELLHQKQVGLIK